MSPLRTDNLGREPFDLGAALDEAANPNIDQHETKRRTVGLLRQTMQGLPYEERKHALQMADEFIKRQAAGYGSELPTIANRGEAAARVYTNVYVVVETAAIAVNMAFVLGKGADRREERSEAANLGAKRRQNVAAVTSARTNVIANAVVSGRRTASVSVKGNGFG
jgi:hypothetical protein